MRRGRVRALEAGGARRSSDDKTLVIKRFAIKHPSLIKIHDFGCRFFAFELHFARYGRRDQKIQNAEFALYQGYFSPSG